MRLKIAIYIVALGFGVPCFAGLIPHRCSHCGCSKVEKICRVVPDVKKVTQTKFVVECEDVGILGRSICQEATYGANCAPGEEPQMVRIPTCDRIVTKKKLKKVTTTVDKPGWKCVVETVCSQCGCECGTANCSK